MNEDYWYEDGEAAEPELPPPLGVLSRGPVWSFCPKFLYCNVHARLCGIFSILTLAECEELVGFLCGLKQVCKVADCDILTPEYFHEELAYVALARGDYAMAQRHRDQMKDPAFLDSVMLQYRPRAMVAKSRGRHPKAKS